MVAQKKDTMLFMIAALSSAALAVIISISLGSRDFLVTSIPGFVIGAFFAYKYFSFDKNKQKQEEHRKSRRNRHR